MEPEKRSGIRISGRWMSRGSVITHQPVNHCLWSDDALWAFAIHERWNEDRSPPKTCARTLEENAEWNSDQNVSCDGECVDQNREILEIVDLALLYEQGDTLSGPPRHSSDQYNDSARICWGVRYYDRLKTWNFWERTNEIAADAC